MEFQFVEFADDGDAAEGVNGGAGRVGRGDGGNGVNGYFHSRANCNARCRTASLIVRSEEMALSPPRQYCGWPCSRRK